MSLTAGAEAGSCPFVFVWDEVSNEWVNHKKILHEANDIAREQTDTKVFQGLQTRFKLAELEAEVARIDEAKLEIVMKSGKTYFLTTKVDPLADRDNRYATLFWDEEIEFHV